ncbi:MAG: hypothetical protein E7673_02755 [Ruminococcaceae bacterium]|nr:hypothetical protein [Oscillospiraceae bacterium]
MKKSLVFILVMLLYLALLSSCKKNKDDGSDKGQKEPTVLEKITTAMDNAYSYEADGVVDIVAYYNGQKMEINETAKDIYAKEQDGSVYYYSLSDTSVIYMAQENKSSVLEAYNEGNYFFTFEQGATVKNLTSPITQEEFLDYQKSTHGKTSFLQGYGNAVFNKNENGDHVVELSQYNKDMLAFVNGAYGFPLDADGAKITDFKVTITAGSDFLVKDISINYAFSKSEFTGTEKITLSNYTGVMKKVKDLKPGYFKAVEDATAVTRALTFLGEMSNKISDTFSVSVIQRSLRNSVFTVTSEANTEVSYGYENDKYHFRVETVSGGEKAISTYEDGVFKSGDQEAKISDIEAKQVIDALIDPYSFTPIMVNKSAKTTEKDGTVLYVLTIDTSRVSSVSGQKAMYITFAVKDNELLYIKYEIEPQKTISGYVGNTFVETTVKFKD